MSPFPAGFPHWGCEKAFMFARSVFPALFLFSGDMVFSGHTTCLMMVALTFRKYCRAKHLQTKVIFTRFHLPERLLWVVRRAVYVYVSCGCLVIVGSKLHYTLDVLLAIFICYW